jgi:hypothetical protein
MNAARGFGWDSETSSQLTPPSSGESSANRTRSAGRTKLGNQLTSLPFVLGDRLDLAARSVLPAKPEAPSRVMARKQRYDATTCVRGTLRPDFFVQSWDTANKATELSDFSVCTTWGVAGKDLFLLGVFRRRLEYPALKRAVRDQQSLFNASDVLIEDRVHIADHRGFPSFARAFPRQSESIDQHPRPYERSGSG